jgi:hypothetical protein
MDLAGLESMFADPVAMEKIALSLFGGSPPTITLSLE